MRIRKNSANYRFLRPIGTRYGADETPPAIVLDPMLHAIADIPCDPPDTAQLVRLLLGLSPVDNSAGVPLTVPTAESNDCLALQNPTRLAKTS
jgi:hypothetical protein